MLEKIKSLSKETLIYGISTIVGRFLNFILVPFYTNVFPPAEYGIVTLVFAYIAILNIFFTLGFESGYFKFASTLEIGDSKENFSLPFFTILINSIVLSSVIYIFSDNLASLIDLQGRYSYFVKFAAFMLLFDAISFVPFAYLRLHNMPVRFTVVKIVNIVTNVTLNFVLVLVFKLGLVSVFIANLAASALTFLLLSPVVIKNITFRFNKKLFNELWRFSLPYVPAGLAFIMVAVVNRPIMQILTDDATVGIFQANFRLGVIMMLLVQMFDYAWRPFFLNNAKEPNAKEMFSKVMTIFMGFASVILIVFTFFIDNIIRIPLIHKGHLIGAEYWSGVYIVPIILFSYLMYGIYINLMAGIYIEKKTKYLPYITGAGVVINIAGNFLLIPIWGMYGAAVTTFLSYFAMMLYIYRVSVKFYPVKYELSKIFLLNTVNLGAVALFYLIFYGILPSNLILKFVLVALLVLAVIYLSGLTKAKVLLKRSVPITGESKNVDVKDEFIP
jgi:O-antigen/teichoic acid export membrane protein